MVRHYLKRGGEGFTIVNLSIGVMAGLSLQSLAARWAEELVTWKTTIFGMEIGTEAFRGPAGAIGAAAGAVTAFAGGHVVGGDLGDGMKVSSALMALSLVAAVARANVEPHGAADWALEAPASMALNHYMSARYTWSGPA